MAKKLTISVSDDTFRALRRQVGRRRVGGFIDDLVRERLGLQSLADAYAAAARDEVREQEARESIESSVGETWPDEDLSDWPGYPGR